jgi:hypothetical protein
MRLEYGPARLRIDLDSGASVELVQGGTCWTVDGDGWTGPRGAALIWPLDSGGGWELRAPDDPDPDSSFGGRVARVSGEAEGEATVVTDDGRLFRVVPVVDPSGEGVWELRGWETSGAYWTARRAGRDWEVQRTVAGSMLAEDPALAVLFAAAIGAADGQDGSRTIP